MAQEPIISFPKPGKYVYKMKFKTNAQCEHCKKVILDRVHKLFPNAQWDLDLQNADKVLEVHGIPENSEYAQQVIKALQETGFEGSWIRG